MTQWQDKDGFGVHDLAGAGSARGTRTDELDLRTVFSALGRHKFWIIAPTLLATAAAFVTVNLITPRYTGEARLLLENRESFYTRPGRDERETQSVIDPEAVQSQVQVIMSNDVVRIAIQRLGLVGNSEFDPGASPLGTLNRILAMAGMSKAVTDTNAEDRVVDKFYERVLVYPVGRSRVVGIEFTSADPELAARGANTMAQLFIETLASAKKDTARTAGTWLSGAIDPLRLRVAEAEAKVEAYRGRMGLYMGGNNTTLAQQQLQEASTQLTASRTQLAEAQARSRLLREAIRTGRTFDIAEVANNDSIRRLIETRSTLRAQIAAESRNLLPQHPTIQALTAQLVDLESQIRSAADRTVRVLETDIKGAQARVEQLGAGLDEQKARASQASEADVQLRALEREAKTLRDQLETYLGRYREASARDADNSTPADARIISRAGAPSKPSFPKKIPITLVAGLAAMMISSSIIVARELMAARGESDDFALDMAADAPSTSLAAPADLEPDDRSGSAHAHASFDDTPDALSALARRIAGSRSPDGIVRLLVCHVGPGNDEAALGLARALASQGRAILVPLAASPGRGGTKARAGLSDLLAGRSSFLDAIDRDTRSRLHVLSPGRGSLDLIVTQSDRFERVLQVLGETYDAVVVDAPEHADDEVLSLVAEHSDAIVIVAQGSRPDERVERSFAVLSRAAGREPYVLLVGSAERAVAS